MGADEREYGKLYPLAKAVVKPIVSCLWRINVTGLHHVPRQGPAILCPNHISFFDSIVLPTVLPRRISYVGKAEYLDDWKTKYIFPAVGMIPIHRGDGSAAARALDTAASVLNRGELFGIYPEGTRSRDGKLHRGHTGAARLALRTGAPIIPVGIRGTDLIQPTGASAPRPFCSCQVNIGPPIDVTRYLDRANDRLVLRQIIDEVMYEIRRLSGQDYVDSYANKPARSAPVAEPVTAPVEADVVPTPNGDPHHVGDGPPVEDVPDRHRVLVGATASDRDDPEEVVDQRPSSAEVLARWWS